MMMSQCVVKISSNNSNCLMMNINSRGSVGLLATKTDEKSIGLRQFELLLFL